MEKNQGSCVNQDSLWKYRRCRLCGTSWGWRNRWSWMGRGYCEVL